MDGKVCFRIYRNCKRWLFDVDIKSFCFVSLRFIIFCTWRRLFDALLQNQHWLRKIRIEASFETDWKIFDYIRTTKLCSTLLTEVLIFFGGNTTPNTSLSFAAFTVPLYSCYYYDLPNFAAFSCLFDNNALLLKYWQTFTSLIHTTDAAFHFHSKYRSYAPWNTFTATLYVLLIVMYRRQNNATHRLAYVFALKR